MIVSNRNEIANSALKTTRFADLCVTDENNESTHIPVVFKQNVPVGEQTIKAGTIGFMYCNHALLTERFNQSTVVLSIDFDIPAQNCFMKISFKSIVHADTPVNIRIGENDTVLTDVVERLTDNEALSNLSDFEKLIETYNNKARNHNKYVNIMQIVITSILSGLILGATLWFICSTHQHTQTTDINILANSIADIMPIGIVILTPSIFILTYVAQLIIKFSPDFADTQAAEQLSTLFENIRLNAPK